MIDRFVQILCNAGLELTPVDVAEMLVLAAYIPPATPRSVESVSELTHTAKTAAADESQLAEQESLNDQIDSQSELNQQADGELFLDHEDEPSSGSVGMRAVPFRTPKAPALPGARKIGRELRPLRRFVPSNRHFVIDEDSTVQQIADGGPQSPVMKPEAEPWLDLALVFDESLTMRVWRPTLIAVKELFERSGIFRNIRSWIINTDTDSPTLHLASAAWQSLQRISSYKDLERRSPRELLDPTGRRLIIVISDCHARGWHSGEAYRLIAQWGTTVLVALLQILPQRFWPGTTMTAVDATLRAHLPGTTNRRLEVSPTWYRKVIEAGGIALPVVSLEEWSIAPWAKLVAGIGGVSAPGLVIPPLPASHLAQSGTTALPESAAQETQTLSPTELVNEFFTNATPLARQLACYLASAPLTLPVMQLVQQAVLPKSRQSHLAEFVLGGLIYQSGLNPGKRPPSEDVVFEFYDGVRDELINRVTKHETVRVITTVSRYIEQRLGEAGEFGALLAVPGVGGDSAKRRIDPLSLRFAQLSTNILQRFGGYEQYIAEINQRIPRMPTTPRGEDNVATDQKVDPESIASLLAEAESLVSQGNTKQAETLYRRIIAIQTSDRRAWQGLARIARHGAASEDTLQLMLAEIHGSSNESARSNAVEAISIAGIRSSEVTEALLFALRDENHIVRRSAAEAIGRLGSEVAAPEFQLQTALWQSLQDTDASVRESASKAIGWISSTGATPEHLSTLTEMLWDQDEVFRTIAVASLGKIGDELSITALQKVSREDPSEQIRRAAVEAIGKLEATRRTGFEPARVFISYGSEDHRKAEQLYRRVLDEGFQPWMDTFNLQSGMEWLKESERAINSANIVLLCLSRQTLRTRGYSQREINIALKRLKALPENIRYLVPVRLEECSIPKRLSRFQAVDLFKSDGWSRLIQVIHSSVQKTPPGASGSAVEWREGEIVAGDVPDDPWKGVFGNRSIRNSRRLSAKVTRRNESHFQVELTVTSTDSSSKPLRGEVQFFLHPTLAKDKPRIRVNKNGKAILRRLSSRAFTAGALADNGATRLELDLKELSDAPEDFRETASFAQPFEITQSRGFQYACYLSYEEDQELTRQFVGSFQTALSRALEKRMGKRVSVFVDRYVLKAGVAFEHEIAAALFRSASYIVFCTQSFFSDPFHQRELEAMKRLQDRRRFLSESHSTAGLILPVLLRDRDFAPKFLRETVGLDFRNAVARGPNWFSTKRGVEQIQEIASVVFKHCREAESIPQAFDNWQEFTLPAADEINTIEYELPEVHFPFRQTDDEGSKLIQQASDHSIRGEYDEARKKLELALKLYQDRRDLNGVTLALNDLGELHYATGNLAQAQRNYEEALEHARKTGLRANAAMILDNLGLVLASTHRYEEAERSYHESLAVFVELGDKAGEAAVLGNLGLLLLNRGEVNEAKRHFEQQLDLARDMEFPQREGIALSNLGIAHARLGDLQGAIEFHNEAVLVFEKLGDRGNQADALHFLSMELKDAGQHDRALADAEQALAIYEQLGVAKKASEVKELLAWLRIDAFVQPKNEGELRIRELALEYEQIRRTMPASDERTRKMEEIVSKMKPLVSSVHSLVGDFAGSTSPGLRLAAVAILQDLPDPEYLDWLADRLKVDKPFIGYHAGVALVSAVHQLDSGFYPRIRDAVNRARASLSRADLKDTDRVRTLERADRELNRNWTSRYFNPPGKIRTIGRPLETGNYSALIDQLKEGEVLIGLFLNNVNALIATHIQNKARMTEMEQIHSRDKYYAVSVSAANEGMDDPIPPEEATRGLRKSRTKKRIKK